LKKNSKIKNSKFFQTLLIKKILWICALFILTKNKQIQKSTVNLSTVSFYSSIAGKKKNN
jgi:hypothetical protein